MKQELQLRYDWSTGGSFDTIDNLREYNLNQRNIASFLRLNSYFATEAELTAIIRRLDIDAD